jgi:hypothetical protein
VIKRDSERPLLDNTYATTTVKRIGDRHVVYRDLAAFYP